jgi:NADPH-dependent 2,4-dienoyl-CoA reductase/sulfur reductase-like enzyme
VQRYDHIIIGAGICGVTAAETIRARDAHGSILVIGDETHPTYSRVMLPHVVRGKTEEARIFLRDDAALAAKGIEVRRGASVTHVDAAAKTVATRDGVTYTYGKLLIASGGRPKTLAFHDIDGIVPQRLQTVEDARAVIAAQRGTSVVIGAGFIALELIMSYAQQGSKVVALLRRDGFFGDALDGASRERLARIVTENGVELRTRTEAVELHRDGDDVVVRTSDGGEIVAQTIGIGIGIDANIAFLDGSGIATGRGVLTDEFLRTDVADVYAAGDVAEFLDPLVGVRHVVGNWQNALFQGKLAGENMTGGDIAFSRVTAYSITCFGVPVSFLGATDIAPDRRVVREDGAGTVQLLIKDARIIGATCIGPFADRAWVMERIEGRTILTDADLAGFRQS